MDTKIKGFGWFRVFVESEEELTFLFKGIQMFKDWSLTIEDHEMASSSITETTPPHPKKIRRAINTLQNVMVPPTQPLPPLPPPPSAAETNEIEILVQEESQFL